MNSGAFRWINDGLTMTSMCHVQNVCEGLVSAAERLRPVLMASYVFGICQT